MNRRNTFLPRVELLDDRLVPSTVNVDAASTVRTIPYDFFGTNINFWDHEVATPQTIQLVKDAGLTMLRQPAGSGSDDWHFNDANTLGAGNSNIADFNNLTEAAGAQAVITVDYGQGSPQEGAAWFAYLNGNPNDGTVLGTGPQYKASTNTWVNKDWKTVGFWASLRASAPLGVDDGLNFLRVNHANSYNFNFAEIGNEIYFNTEDKHAVPNDPATYVGFAKTFAQLVHSFDPSVQVGMGVQGTKGDFLGKGIWAAQILDQCKTQNYVPDFLADHSYMFNDPVDVSDAKLLQHTATDPNGYTTFEGRQDWVGRASQYRDLITSKLGAAGANIQLFNTEFNSSTINDPPKQTTSLVNGLFIADSVGGILQTEFTHALVWDLRNGYDTTPGATGTYGWRPGGDEGLIGSDYQIPNGNPTPPTSGPYVLYPSYFGAELAGMLAQTGGTVVATVSDTATLSAYSVLEPDGRLALLVINKDSANAITNTFNLSGFNASGAAELWQYGKTQDNAQQMTADGAASLFHSSAPVTLNNGAFTMSFPSYSMTLLELSPATGTPPAISIAPGTLPFAVVGVAYSQTLTVTGGTGPFSFALIQGPLPAGLSLSSDGIISGTPTTAGTVSFAVYVAAGNGTTTQNYTMTIQTPEDAEKPIRVGENQIAVGADTGGTGVKIFNADGTVASSIDPIPGFTGGIRTAVGDFNRDGKLDIVSATGPGMATEVVVTDGGTHQTLATINPFESTFIGGVFVAVGDLNGDGIPDLVVTPDQGGGPVVAVYDGAALGKGQVQELFRFFGIDDPNFRGGARASIGDIRGGGYGDLVVAAGFGGGPRIAAFDGKSIAAQKPSKLFGDFFAFEPTLTNGTYIAVGDVNNDGKADLVAGGGPGGGPRVSVFDGAAILNGTPVRDADFFAGDVENRGGVRVSIKNLLGDGHADLVVGAGSGAGSKVTAYSGKMLTTTPDNPTSLFSEDAFPGFGGGIYVG